MLGYVMKITRENNNTLTDYYTRKAISVNWLTFLQKAKNMSISNMLWKPLTEWFWVLGHIILQATYPCYQYIKGKSTVEEKRNI